MRIMGLDFGSKTVGVAVSDELLITAQAKEIIRREREDKLRRTCARIEELIEEYGVERIVLGLPKNMNDTQGDRAEKTREFGDMLIRRTGLDVVYWDERLTTVAADKVMMETGIRREHRRDYVDMIAAALILQGYLDHLAMQTGGAGKTADVAADHVENGRKQTENDRKQTENDRKQTENREQAENGKLA